MTTRIRGLVLALLLCVAATADAATISFTTDPFAGSTALTTPGRQIVGGELFTSFDSATDVFEFDSAFFPIGDSIVFANDVIANLPTSGLNAIVLRTFDTDSDPGTPFGAATAANLIADRVTTSGAGFFVYFNSGLDVARLVYSTDLSDATADLKVLARLTNFSGQAGRDAMAALTASNFRLAATSVPEPATSALFGLGLLAVGLTRARRRSAPRASVRNV